MDLAAHIIGLERAALDRWAQGDPSGFLKLSADDVVYFDPFQAARVDGLNALRSVYEPLAGTFTIDVLEMINPRVQAGADMAVLTFNLRTCTAGKTERWNCTEVYRLRGEEWRIIQTHWSFTQPAL